MRSERVGVAVALDRGVLARIDRRVLSDQEPPIGHRCDPELPAGHAQPPSGRLLRAVGVPVFGDGKAWGVSGAVQGTRAPAADAPCRPQLPGLPSVDRVGAELADNESFEQFVDRLPETLVGGQVGGDDDERWMVAAVDPPHPVVYARLE